MTEEREKRDFISFLSSSVRVSSEFCINSKQTAQAVNDYECAPGLLLLHIMPPAAFTQPHYSNGLLLFLLHFITTNRRVGGRERERRGDYCCFVQLTVLGRGMFQSGSVPLCVSSIHVLHIAD